MNPCSILLFAFIVVGCVLNLIGLFTPYWSRKDPADRVNEFIDQHAGIWIQCTSYVTGNFDCDDFNRSILGLPIHIIVGRLVGVFAAILGLVGIILLTCSWDCCAKVPARRKVILNHCGGCLTIASGVGLIAAMGFYADIILKNYYIATDPFDRRRNGFVRDIFGWSLFVGWTGGAIQVVCGILVEIYTCCCMEKEDDPSGFTYDNNGARNFAYRAEQPAPLYGKEYV